MLLCTLLLLLVPESWALSTGAPDGACDSMIPGHGPSPLPKHTATHMLTVNEIMTGYYEVRLHPKGRDEWFKGFLLQARQGTKLAKPFGVWKEQFCKSEMA